MLKVSITNNKINQYHMCFQVIHYKENHLTFAVFLPKIYNPNPIMRKHQKTQRYKYSYHITVLKPSEKNQRHERQKQKNYSRLTETTKSNVWSQIRSQKRGEKNCKGHYWEILPVDSHSVLLILWYILWSI